MKRYLKSVGMCFWLLASTTLISSLFDVAHAQPWSDNFDSYATDSQLNDQGGWNGWLDDPSAHGAFTSNEQARSAPNSVAIVGASDLVHTFNITSGKWVYTAWQYLPTDYDGTDYFIMLNTYSPSELNWSMQINFDGLDNLLVNDGQSGGTLPLIKGRWVQIRIVIDLDNDTQAFFYNNQLLFQGSWTQEKSGNGALRIAAIDLYAADSSAVVYYDDMRLINEGFIVSCGESEYLCINGQRYKAKVQCPKSVIAWDNMSYVEIFGNGLAEVMGFSLLPNVNSCVVAIPDIAASDRHNIECKTTVIMTDDKKKPKKLDLNFSVEIMKTGMSCR